MRRQQKNTESDGMGNINREEVISMEERQNKKRGDRREKKCDRDLGKGKKQRGRIVAQQVSC